MCERTTVKYTMSNEPTYDDPCDDCSHWVGYV